MKILTIVLPLIIALLCITAGGAKVMQAPQEVQFLTAQGLSMNMIFIFGGLQILAGLLIVFPKTRIWGLTFALLAFLASSILIFNSGNMGFSAVSIAPVLITGFLIYRCLAAKN